MNEGKIDKWRYSYLDSRMREELLDTPNAMVSDDKTK